MKYDSPKNEGEILPNKLGLTDPQKIQKEEYRGFLRAELKYESEIERIVVIPDKLTPRSGAK